MDFEHPGEMGELTSEQQAAPAALGVPRAKAAPVPAQSGSPAPMDDGPVQPAPSDAQAPEDHDQSSTVTEEEREIQAARGRARALRMNELMRGHSKVELLRIADADGLVNHDSPEKWRRDESPPLSCTSSSGRPTGPPQPGAVGARPVSAKPLLGRDHHDECDKMLYEGGTCTCDLIEQYGPPSERDDY